MQGRLFTYRTEVIVFSYYIVWDVGQVEVSKSIEKAFTLPREKEQF